MLNDPRQAESLVKALYPIVYDLIMKSADPQEQKRVQEEYQKLSHAYMKGENMLEDSIQRSQAAKDESLDDGYNRVAINLMRFEELLTKLSASGMDMQWTWYGWNVFVL